jgi:ferredoxin
MRKYKEVQKTEQVIDDVICDMCGDTCMKQYETGANAVKTFVGVHIEQPWGYLSNKDLEYWEADICEKCVDERLSPIINFVKVPYLKNRFL